MRGRRVVVFALAVLSGCSAPPSTGDSGCTTRTCAQQSAECGLVEDGCGNTLFCGDCGQGLTCSTAHRCVASCVPQSCAQQGHTCGLWPDGCGNTLFCGECPDAGPGDAGDTDAGSGDAGAADAGTSDAGASDAGLSDAGTSDAGSSDAGSSDAGTSDAGTSDAGTPDAGTPDAGTPDAGVPDAGTFDAGTSDAGTSDAGAPDAGLRGLVGSPCDSDIDCTGGGFCAYGFCTRICGAFGVPNCNAAGVADPAGPLGGIYTCWALGPSLVSLCWPNGSGQACTTTCPTGETCVGGRCQVGSGATPRTSLQCTREAQCAAGETCVPVGDLDQANVRLDGACLNLGAGAFQKGGPGATCSTDAQCRNARCRAGTCAAMCVTDGDCGASRVCEVEGMPSTALAAFEEYPRLFSGFCADWAGSRGACSSNGGCGANEVCAPVKTLTNGDQTPGVRGACRAQPNPAGALVGAACTADPQCRSGRCFVNRLTGLGVCTEWCLGGAADCGGGTSCVATTLDGLNPATAADNLTAGQCRSVALGAACDVTPACTTCTTDADCRPTEGVLCVRASAADPTGICRDGLGRCADPCRTCTPGGSDCPGGSTCVTVQASSTVMVTLCENPDGTCQRASLPPRLTYAHAQCGGSGTNRCYFQGRLGSGATAQDVFTCGTGCFGGMSTCGSIPLSGGGSLSTNCRAVYEYGVRLPDGGVAGAAPVLPTQCAPASAFSP